jgi:FtsH-binding integral membrane protein
MALSDSRRVSRIGLGACMVAAPLLFTASDILDRSVNSDNDAKYVAQVAAHHKAHWLAGLFMMLGAIALLGAVLGLAHLVRTRKPALANVAGPLAAVGTFALFGWSIITMGVDPALGRSPNRAAMVALYHDASNSSDLAPNLVLMFVFLLAVVALSFGLYRARVVPRVLAVLLGLSMAALFVSSDGASQWVASALFIVGMGGIGLTVLGRSDEEWESGAMPVAEAPARPEAPATASA